MPLTFEVVFIDKIVGEERRVIVDWECWKKLDLNRIAELGAKKVHKYLCGRITDLSFQSIRRV